MHHLHTIFRERYRDYTFIYQGLYTSSSYVEFCTVSMVQLGHSILTAILIGTLTSIA